MIEALDEDECTWEVFEFVVGTACAFSLNGYYRCEVWINIPLVYPNCFGSPLIVVSKIIIEIHFAVEKRM